MYSLDTCSSLFEFYIVGAVSRFGILAQSAETKTTNLGTQLERDEIIEKLQSNRGNESVFRDHAMKLGTKIIPR